MQRIKNSLIAKSNAVNYILIGFSVSIILFFTLLNRNASFVRGLLSPGWTIHEIALGNRNTLIESLENILLFIPFGLFLSRFKNIKFLTVFFIGLSFSVIIELTQFIFYLGWSEIDDVVYNTLGMIIGYIFTRLFGFSVLFLNINLKSLIAILMTTVVCTSLVFVGLKIYEINKAIHLKKFAAMSDMDENTPNLLILNGKNGIVAETDIEVSYNKNGTLSICGSSDLRTWFLISEFELEPGKYFFTGLQNVDDYTVALELEFYSEEEDNYIRFTPDIGPIDSYEFEIDKITAFRAYIGIYECSDINLIAAPALYKLKG